MVSSKKSVFEYLIVIRFRGTYDYDGLMELLRSYYYRHVFDSLSEPKMKYKMGGTGAEVNFKMEGDRKITHYIKAYLIIEGHMWDVLRREEVINGEKKTVTGGKLELKLKGEFELDYGKGFSDKKALDMWMQNALDAELTGLQFLDNKTTGKKFMEHILLKLDKQIKEFLGMECY